LRRPSWSMAASSRDLRQARTFAQALKERKQDGTGDIEAQTYLQCKNQTPTLPYKSKPKQPITPLPRIAPRASPILPHKCAKLSPKLKITGRLISLKLKFHGLNSHQIRCLEGARSRGHRVFEQCYHILSRLDVHLSPKKNKGQ
jgi:hypothetical protein